MNKRELYDTFNDLESELKNTLFQITEMKQTLNDLLERNTSLELENQHLRARLQELEKAEESPTITKQELSKSRMNLEKLYDEGFHVCNVYYGSRRANDEECAFCLSVIYGERSK